MPAPDKYAKGLSAEPPWNTWLVFPRPMRILSRSFFDSYIYGKVFFFPFLQCVGFQPYICTYVMRMHKINQCIYHHIYAHMSSECIKQIRYFLPYICTYVMRMHNINETFTAWQSAVLRAQIIRSANIYLPGGHEFKSALADFAFFQILLFRSVETYFWGKVLSPLSGHRSEIFRNLSEY